MEVEASPQFSQLEEKGVGEGDEGRLVNADIQHAICRVQTTKGGKGYTATGFYFIFEGRPCMMTNEHVIPSKDIALGARLTFGYTKHGLKIGVRCYPDRYFWSSTDLDATIVEIDDDSLRAQGIDGLEVLSHADAPVARDDPVNIFGHPDGDFLKMSMNQVKDVKGGVSKVEVSYNADTHPGSSGSPVFNSTFRVVALHAKGGKGGNTGYDIHEILKTAPAFRPSHFNDFARRSPEIHNLSGHLSDLVMTRFPEENRKEDYILRLFNKVQQSKESGFKLVYTNQLALDHIEDGYLDIAWRKDKNCWDCVFMKVDQLGKFATSEARKSRASQHFQDELRKQRCAIPCNAVEF